MSDISQQTADRAKTKAQLLAELNELRRRVAHLEAAAEPLFQPGESEPYAAVVTFTDITEQRQAAKLLRQSEEKYRIIFNNDIYAIGIFDLETRQILDVNEAVIRLYGYSRAELLGGMNVYDLTAEPQAVYEATIQEAISVGPMYVPLRYHRKKDGTIFPVELGMRFNQWQGREVMFVLIHDISERIQAEAQLRESERFVQATIDALSEHLCVLDEKGVIIAVNRAWCEFAEANPPVPANYGVGANYLAVCDGASGSNGAEADTFAAGIRAVMRGEIERFSLEYPCASPSEPRWFLGLVTRFPGEGPVRLVISHQNITAIKQAQEALAESERKYRQVVEQSNDAIILTDETGRLIEWNGAAEQILGLKRAEAMGAMVWDNLFRISPADQQTSARHEQLKTQWLTYFQTGQHPSLNQAIELEIQHPDGARRTVQPARYSIKTEQGYLLSAVIRDVTERKQAEAALRASEEKYRQLVELAQEGIWRIDAAACTTYVNPRMAQMLGYTGDEMIGRHLFSFMDEQGVKLAQANLERRQQGIKEQHDFEFIRRDGQRIHTLISTAAMTDDAGNYGGAMAMVTDITERQQAQTALQESEARYRLLFQNNLDAVFLTTLDGRTLDANSAACAMFGYTLAEICGLGRAGLVDTADPRLPLALEERTRTGKFRSELTYLRRDGTPFPGESSSTVFPDQNGELKTSMIIRDITQRKAAEENLRRYEQIVSTTPDWMSLVDRNYVYQIVNEAFLVLDTKTYDQVVGHTVAELVGETVFTEMIKPRMDQALAGETAHYQDWFDFPAAGRRFVNVTYAPYQEKDGAISGVLVSGRDVTEAKLLEEHLQHVQKMGVIGQLAAGMAHHYNSMLTGIIGFTSLSLHMLPPSDPVAKNLERVLNTAERMAVLVRQLLAFSQKQLFQLKTAPLNDLVIQLQGQLKQMAPAPIEFIFDLTPDVGQVKVDPRQFEYLLQALVSNARDAMPDGGRLTLTTTHVSLGEMEAGWYDLIPGDYVLLTVKDTGTGLTEEAKSHLFEPFFTTKDVGQGTGLGLAMSLGIAKQHGGHLLAESEPGQETTFMLYLPCLAPPSTSLPPTKAAPTQAILLIEAEPMVREFVAEVLSDQGYTVLKATTNEAALQLLAGRPEASLQLLLAPAHSNSPALIEQLKTNSPGLKVILLIDDLKELPPERVDFLLKPFTPSGLVQKVRAVLEAAPK